MGLQLADRDGPPRSSPSWRYAGLVSARAARASSMLDIQSGGGEMLATLPRHPPLLVAAEGYAPNVAVAARRCSDLSGPMW